MSFYEYWAEASSGRRGPIGKVTFGEQHDVCRCRPLIVARFIFTVIALPVVWYFTVPLVPLPLWQAIAAVVGGTLVYVALAYLINIEPDTDNMGLAGGLIDNPFRYTDDINRNMMGLAMLLGPGRFIAESVIDLGVLFEQEPVAEEFGYAAEQQPEPDGAADAQLQQYLGASRAPAAEPPQPTEEEELAASGLSTARFMQSGTQQQEQGLSRFGR